MADVETSITLVGWRERSGRFAKATETLRNEQITTAKAVMDLLKAAAAKETPRGTGNGPHMADQWQTDVKENSDGATATLANASAHAASVIFGARPHEIVPVHASVLHFEKGGESVFTTRVHHPGNKPNDIPGRVEAALGPFAEVELGKAAGRVSDWVGSIFT